MTLAKGPLASFIKGMNDGSNTQLLQCGEITTASKRPRGSTGSGYRSGQRYGSKRADRPRGFKRKQTAQPKLASGTCTNNDCHVTTPDEITLICVRCGDAVAYTNENRCENCFADDQQKWHGKSLNSLLYRVGDG